MFRFILGIPTLIAISLMAVSFHSETDAEELPPSHLRTSAATAVRPLTPLRGEVVTGQASWYGRAFDGRRTASGEKFDATGSTAAHRTLPFGTLLRVTNLANGREHVVRINDRGPYQSGRMLDLSQGAAQALDMDEAGVSSVEVEILTPPATSTKRDEHRGSAT